VHCSAVFAFSKYVFLICFTSPNNPFLAKTPTSALEVVMRRTVISILSALMMLSGGIAHADKYDETIELFKNAGESASFFSNSYGYAVFPTVGKEVW
jgi:hypothetical protein